MFEIRSMTMEDYDGVIQLMKRTPGITVRDADSRDATRRYLERNPGLKRECLIARFSAPSRIRQRHMRGILVRVRRL